MDEDIKALLEDCRDFVSHQIGSSHSETNKEDEELLNRIDEALS